MIHFHPINPNAKNYPPPKVPVLPVFIVQSLKLNITDKNKFSAFYQNGIFFSHARNALVQALIDSGVNSEHSVLIPSYHCGSMVEPALWLNCHILFYRLNDDLTPDINHLETLLHSAKYPIKAMLLTHYFGFLQNAPQWVNFCHQHKIILIEDCAHAFFGHSTPGQLAGTYGDYAIASVRKFFGVPDGGILIGKSIKSVPPLKPHSFKQELRAGIQTTLEAAHAGKLGYIGRLLTVIDKWRAKARKTQSTHPNSQITNQPPSTWLWFNPDLMDYSGYNISQWIMQHTHPKDNIDKRRQNYQLLIKGIHSIKKLKPLYPELPDTTAPYMLPVILESDESDFDRLKRAGIPIWRWEELAESDCQVSQRYRLKLLQIPCHQSLNIKEINWILHNLQQLLGKR